jgi:hypothetical protein
MKITNNRTSPLTVKELIAELQTYDLESEVQFSMDVGCCGETECLEFHDVDSYYNKHVVINFDVPEFLNSCRKYANCKGE